MPEEVIKGLHKKMDGWVAGLRMAIDKGLSRNSKLLCSDESVTGELFDYFANELLESTESDELEFLLKTSYLRQFSVSMAEKLTGFKRCDKILSQKHCKYFIARKQTPDGMRFQYQKPFREFLLSRAERYFNGGKHEIMSLASELLEQNGYVEASIELCIEASDFEKLNLIIIRHASPMLAQGRFGILNKWFALIPDEIITVYPWLLYWKGMCLFNDNPRDAREILIYSYTKFKTAFDLEGMLSSFCSIVDTFIYEWKDFRSLDYWINEFGELVKHHKSPRETLRHWVIPEELRQRVVAGIFSALLFRQPGHPQTADWVEEAVKILHYSDTRLPLMPLGHNLVLYFLWTGKMVKAGVIVETLSPIAEKAKQQPMSGLMFYRSKALYQYYAACYQRGQTSVEGGLKLAGECGVHSLDYMFSGTGIYNSLAIGDNLSAQTYLRHMVSSMGRDRCFDKIYHHHMVSLISLGKGDCHCAMEHAGISLQLALQAGSPLIIGIFRCIIAYILTESGRFEEAKLNIEEALKIAAETGSTLFTCSCAFIDALIALYENASQQFSEKLKTALELRKSTGLKFVFPLQSSVARLCTAALDNNLETDSIKEIIGHYGIVPGVCACDNWPYPIKIYTLGKFEIYKDGRLVGFSGKTQKIPLLMLKATIAYGVKDVDFQQLSDRLWPDSDGDAVAVTFRSTLHRLRKIFGEKESVIYTDRLVALNPRYCWVDVWSFSKLIDDIEGVCIDAADCHNSGRDMQGELGRLFDRLTSLYKGDFLPMEQSMSWSVPMRERLKDKFIQSCFLVGNMYEKLNDWDRAIRCYKKALEADCHYEKLFQRIMACCHKSGQTLEAVSIYKECSGVLSAYGLKPSPATENILKSILG